MTELNPIIAKVTERIVKRSARSRRHYLDLIERGRDAGTNRDQLSCGNLAHAFAASGEDKPVIRTGAAMNIGIVTAYNDMLSAHQPMAAIPKRSSWPPAKSAPRPRWRAVSPPCATA